MYICNDCGSYNLTAQCTCGGGMFLATPEEEAAYRTKLSKSNLDGYCGRKSSKLGLQAGEADDD